MSVRAKFSVSEITEVDGYYGKGHSIKMNPVYGGVDAKDEDKRFFNSTPAGSLELVCVNPNATVQFEKGKSYYLDFSPAD